MVSYFIFRVNVECLESFRRADIYSLGLVMWEVCRRCISNGVALEYAMPYYEWLPSNNQEPSIEEMRKLVSLDQRRPPLPNRWHSDPVNNQFSRDISIQNFNYPVYCISPKSLQGVFGRSVSEPLQ